MAAYPPAIPAALPRKLGFKDGTVACVRYAPDNYCE
jgi:hypothetical protein